MKRSAPFAPAARPGTTGATRISLAVALAAALLAGCSDRDPVTTTPVFHVGTPTNRSSVESWELNREPFYTQPGVNPGQIVAPPAPRPSERGFELYDPIASTVFQALNDAHIDTKYLTATAQNGVVVLSGSADNVRQLKKALAVAKGVHGVRRVDNEMTAASGGS
jgi:hypothetical protein